MTDRGRSVRRRAGISLVLVALIAGTAWIGSAYVRLLRLQVEVADACARVEASSRERLELVRNLVQFPEAFAPVGSERLAAVDSARRQAGAEPFVPQTLADDERYRAFVAAHEQLTVALVEFWPAARAVRRVETQAILDDLETGLAGTERELLEGVAQLEHRTRSYVRACRKFPGSLVAGFARLEGQLDLSIDPVAGPPS